MVSVTVATWSRRTRRPSSSGISRRPISAAVPTVPIVRIDCSVPPMPALPPDDSCCTCRTRREISAAVTLSACRRVGSSSTRISRATPPTLATLPTPGTVNSERVTSLSTNQDRASSSIRSLAIE
jgi:hypothetical protein